MPAPEDPVDALYGLPFDRFVPERDALAKALRAEGDRAGADAVRKLAKPTRAAWAVNAAVREHPDRARALAESARLLGDAQQELLAGGDASALREATDHARAAVAALAEAAPRSGDATADKVRSTLHAATVDPEVLAEVVAGRVERERAASGFGGLEALLAAGAGGTAGRRPAARRRDRAPTAEPEPAGRPARAKADPAADDRRRAKEERARAAAEREQARRREKLRRAKEGEAEAEQAVAAARSALEQVESALADRRGQLREAEARLKDARRRRERAER
jgi:hypothetical protein